jgi:hypothetical protein
MNNKKHAIKHAWLYNFNNGFDMDKPEILGLSVDCLVYLLA